MTIHILVQYKFNADLKRRTSNKYTKNTISQIVKGNKLEAYSEQKMISWQLEKGP